MVFPYHQLNTSIATVYLKTLSNFSLIIPHLEFMQLIASLKGPRKYRV